MQNNRAEFIKGGFRKRSLPLSADYRPMYKIGLIVLILDLVSAGAKSSLNRLHFFVWALKSSRHREFTQNILLAENTDAMISWGVEPSLNKALLFAVAEGLVELKDDMYKLTGKGKEFTELVKNDEKLLIHERQFLSQLGKRAVTEKLINELIKKMSE